jgi:hypothetical protein
MDGSNAGTRAWIWAVGVSPIGTALTMLLAIYPDAGQGSVEGSISEGEQFAGGPDQPVAVLGVGGHDADDREGGGTRW